MRRGRRHRLGHVGQELNLVPYLDIMVNLVLFMLVTITSFLSFTILNASIPQIAPDSAQVEEKMKKEELLLVVRVLKDGYRVDPSVQGGAAIEKRTLPKKEDKYDVESLREFMVGLKNRFKDENKVLIVADPNINYESIIVTMDSVRETEPALENLFPEVTLSIL
ncbi:MAG: biopolymer transporter ExbD [Bdellovibrionota bacterium]